MQEHRQKGRAELSTLGTDFSHKQPPPDLRIPYPRRFPLHHPLWKNGNDAHSDSRVSHPKIAPVPASLLGSGKGEENPRPHPRAVNPPHPGAALCRGMRIPEGRRPWDWWYPARPFANGSRGPSQPCVCHQADPQAENKPNPSHRPPGRLVPSQDDGTAPSPHDSCFPGGHSRPPRPPTLSKGSKDHAGLRSPPWRAPRISGVQQAWRALALLSPGKRGSRNSGVGSPAGHGGGSLFFFSPNNLISHSTEQRNCMETLGIRCVA